MSMPAQKPGKSEQVVVTPDEFLDAVRERLRIVDFGWDLAADASNAKCEIGLPYFYTEEQNSLAQLWYPHDGWLWCNPPYSHIEPWVEKASIEAKHGAHIAMLVPASVGSGWWFKWVTSHAYITFLNPRLTFVGHKSPYPKDLALLLYAPFLSGGNCDWKWK